MLKEQEKHSISPIVEDILTFLEPEQLDILKNIGTTDLEIKKILFSAECRLRIFVNTGNDIPLTKLLNSSQKVEDFLTNSTTIANAPEKIYTILSYIRYRIEKDNFLHLSYST